MLPALLLFSLASAAPSIGVHGELRGRSAGLVDGVTADLRLPLGPQLTLQAGGMARLSNLAWDAHWEDAWLRASELGTLDDRGTLPIAADVWSADVLAGVRIVEAPVALHLQGGATVRGQAAALLLSDSGDFTVRNDVWDGAVRVRPLNPVVGLAVTLPSSPALAVELSVQQVFPINDPVLSAQPGFTVVRVGARLGRTSPASANGNAQLGPPGIRPLGVASLDDFFGKIEGILTELERLDGALDDAHRSLARVAQLQDQSVEDFLAKVRGGAIDLGLSVQMHTGRPKVSVRPDLTGELGEAAAAIQAMGDAAAEVVAAVPVLVERAQKLVQAAQGLAKSGPAEIKAAGLSPMQVPKVVGDLKHNVQVTTGLPAALSDTLSTASTLLSSLGTP